MQWIIDNKEWLFSGAGITIISILVWMLRRNNDKKESGTKNNQSIGNIASSGGGSVNINQTINHQAVPNQIQITLMALKQMPGRIQEAANSGNTSFSFDEARSELEKLYALSISEGYPSLVESLEKFQSNYNEYIALINRAINKEEATLDEINMFHAKNIVAEFENNVRLPN